MLLPCTALAQALTQLQWGLYVTGKTQSVYVHGGFIGLIPCANLSALRPCQLGLCHQTLNCPAANRYDEV